MGVLLYTGLLGLLGMFVVKLLIEAEIGKAGGNV